MIITNYQAHRLRLTFKHKSYIVKIYLLTLYRLNFLEGVVKLLGYIHKKPDEQYFVSENGCVRLVVAEEHVKTIECRPAFKDCYDRFALFLTTLDALESFTFGLSIDSIPAFETKLDGIRYRFSSQITKDKIDSLRAGISSIRDVYDYNSEEAKVQLNNLLKHHVVEY